VLKGKKYTVGLSEEVREQLGFFEKENYTEEALVQDGKVITARGRAFIPFGIRLGRALNLTFDKSWYGA